MLDTIEIPPSRWVIVTCTTGFSWREAWSLIVESPSILTKKILFCPATGGLGPLGPLVYASMGRRQMLSTR